MSNKVTFTHPEVHRTGFIEPLICDPEIAYIETDDGEAVVIPCKVLREYLSQSDPEYADRVAELEAKIGELEGGADVDTGPASVEHAFLAPDPNGGEDIECSICVDEDDVGVWDVDGDHTLVPLAEVRAALAKWNTACGLQDVGSVYRELLERAVRGRTDAALRASATHYRAGSGTATTFLVLADAAELLQSETGSSDGKD